MNKTIFLITFVIFLTSCTIYTEKQSEALSRSVYATKDSIDEARVDLADNYINEATRIVKPPKNRIEIKPITQHIPILGSDSKNNTQKPNKQRVVIVPSRYKNDTVIVIGSKEYEQLLKDKEIYAQIEKENKKLIDTRKLVDEELLKQKEYADELIRDLNILQKKVIEKDLAILQRNVVIFLLILSIGGGVYLRIKGIL